MMRVYYGIGAGGSKSRDLVQPLKNEIMKTALGDHIVGDMVQVNMAMSHKDAETGKRFYFGDLKASEILDRSPFHPERPSTQIFRNGFGHINVDGIRSIAERAIQERQDPVIAFLDYEPGQGLNEDEVFDPDRFDSARRYPTDDEFELVSRSMNEIRNQMRRESGIVSDVMLWNTPTGNHEGVNWDGVRDLHKFCGIESVFFNAYKPHDKPRHEFNHAMKGMEKLKIELPGKRIIMAIQPNIPGLDGFNIPDIQHTLAKILAASWIGADLYIWGDAEWSRSHTNKAKIVTWANAVGRYLS